MVWWRLYRWHDDGYGYDDYSDDNGGGGDDDDNDHGDNNDGDDDDDDGNTAAAAVDASDDQLRCLTFVVDQCNLCYIWGLSQWEFSAYRVLENA